MNKKVNVAVVGATGEVGQAMLSILEQRDFPVAGLHIVASSRSAGKRIEFREEELVVEDLDSFDFSGIDIGLFSPGATVIQHPCAPGRRRRDDRHRQYVPVSL